LNSKQLAERIAEIALEKKAEEIIIMDLKDIASFTDRFVICSADSTTQVKAIADHIMVELKNEGEDAFKSEGFEALNWVLLDYVDVVVHVFLKPTRVFYGLEKMWGDAKKVKIEDKLIKPKKIIKKRKNAEVSGK
jgi:ribosome-associated protein